MGWGHGLERLDVNLVGMIFVFLFFLITNLVGMMLLFVYGRRYGLCSVTDYKFWTLSLNA